MRFVTKAKAMTTAAQTFPCHASRATTSESGAAELSPIHANYFRSLNSLSRCASRRVCARFS